MGTKKNAEHTRKKPDNIGVLGKRKSNGYGASSPPKKAKKEKIPSR